MADIIDIVGPGETYQTLSEWQAARQTTLPDGNIYIAKMKAFTDTIDVQISGWGLPDINSHVEIRANDGEAHGGVRGAGYVLQGIERYLGVLGITQQFTVVEDIEVIQLNKGQSSTYAIWADAENTTIRRCIAEAGLNSAFYLSRNNCSIDASWGIGNNSTTELVLNCAANRTILAENMTCTNGAYGAVLGNQATARNIVCYDNVTGDYSGTPLSALNCAASDGSAPAGGTPVQNLTDVDFVDPTTSDYNPAPGGKLAGAGDNTVLPLTAINLVPFLDPPSIGGYEVEGGAPPGAELAGTSVGSSSVVGALIVSALLAGSVTGTSTATGDLTDFPSGSDLAGITAGTSTATGDLTAFPLQPGEALEGIATGTSTATGDLSAAPAGLAGALQGTSTATGDLTTLGAVTLEGIAAGTSTATGVLSTSVTLAGLAEGSSLAIATFASNLPPRIPIAMDLSPFFQNDDLSHDATLNGLIDFKAIVVQWYDPITGGQVGMGSQDPLLICDHSLIPDVQENDTIVVASYTYVVREVQPDNTGIVRLKCELP